MNAPASERMPVASGMQPADLSAWFDEHKPWNAGFLSLMRCIAARDKHAPAPGTARLPQEETFVIGQQPTMAFAPREIASLLQRHGKLDIRLFGLGIWGAQGPLPLHLTELAYSRTEARQDHTLVNFVDLFHHRALSLFYRAWASSQATVSLDRASDESFSFYVGSLMGLDPAEAATSCLPVHARLAGTAHLIRESRSPEGIASTLAHYFGVPVSLDEYVMHWIQLDPSEHCRAGIPGPAAVMGEGAMLGEMIPDRQHKFRLVIGPLDLDQYLRFTPKGADLPELVEWVRAFTGFEYAWEVKLLVKPRAAPPARADTSQKLGYSTWLGEAADDIPVTGMVFEPEHY